MTVLYTLMEFGVVRFNEMKKYIGSISYKTLSATLKELEADKLIYRKEYPQIPPKRQNPGNPGWTLRNPVRFGPYPDCQSPARPGACDQTSHPEKQHRQHRNARLSLHHTKNRHPAAAACNRPDGQPPDPGNRNVGGIL